MQVRNNILLIFRPRIITTELPKCDLIRNDWRGWVAAWQLPSERGDFWLQHWLLVHRLHPGSRQGRSISCSYQH